MRKFTAQLNHISVTFGHPCSDSSILPDSLQHGQRFAVRLAHKRIGNPHVGSLYPCHVRTCDLDRGPDRDRADGFT